MTILTDFGYLLLYGKKHQNFLWYSVCLSVLYSAQQLLSSGIDVDIDIQDMEQNSMCKPANIFAPFC